MRCFRTLCCLVLTLLLVVPTTQAQEAPPLTPDEAVRLALNHNRTLLAATAQADAVEARARAVRTQRLPTLRGSGQYTRLSSNIPDPTLSVPAIPGLDTTALSLVEIPLDRYALRVGVEQPLFTGFRITNQVQAAKRYAEAEQRRVAEVRAAVAFQARQAFWALHQAQAVLAVTEQAVAQMEAQLTDAENRRDAGMATESDVLALRARLAEIRLDRIDADNAVRLARLTLNTVTGRPLDAPVEPVAEVDVTPDVPSVDAVVERALDARPQLAALRARVDGLAAEVDVARAGWYPQVALTGEYLYANPNPYDFLQESEFLGTWEAGVRVSMDLWTWGRTRAQTSAAKARLRQAEALLAAARDSVRMDVTRSVLDVQRAVEAVQAATASVRQAEAAYAAMQDRYEQGLALTAELLSAEVAYRRAETRLARARADYAVARAGLWRAQGRTGRGGDGR
jgi:outer membrane protein TolC